MYAFAGQKVFQSFSITHLFNLVFNNFISHFLNDKHYESQISTLFSSSFVLRQSRG
jgi:hypothetical protein